MLTIFILVFDGCAVAKYLIQYRVHQLLSVLNLTVPFPFVFSSGLTLTPKQSLFLTESPGERKYASSWNLIINYHDRLIGTLYLRT